MIRDERIPCLIERVKECHTYVLEARVESRKCSLLLPRARSCRERLIVALRNPAESASWLLLAGAILGLVAIG